jgi:His/Glu/Gln/Arg/opine family amino acid ABC transporter permease subunit
LSDLVPNLLLAGLVTLQISAGAWFVSVCIGLAFALLRSIGAITVRIPLLATATTMRSVPQWVVIYLVYYGLGAMGINLPPLVGAVLALGVVEGAFTAEYFHAAFSTVPASQYDAGGSLGLSSFNIMRLIIIPQALPFSIPPLVNSFVGLLKTATLASAVGIPEILYRARDDMSRTGTIVPVITIVMIIYIVATIPLTRAAASLEGRIRSSRR